jgi:hypothetical protein
LHESPLVAVSPAILGDGTLSVDNAAREGQTLAAFWPQAERAIGLTRGRRSTARRIADIAFTNRITDADDHVHSLAEESISANANCSQAVLRISRIIVD